MIEQVQRIVTEQDHGLPEEQLELPAEREGSRRLFYDVFVPDGLQCVFTDRVCLLPDGSEVRV